MSLIARHQSPLSVVLAFLIAAALPSPAAAQKGLPTIELPRSFDADAVELYADKLDVYARLLAGTSRTTTNALRYLKSFNPKTGPTGNERSSYDLVNLDDERYARLVAAARSAAAEPPAIPLLDKAALAYADAVASNPAIFNEAAKYYSSERAYEQDRYQHGKELHPKIAHELDTFFATLPPFMGFLHQVRAAVDPQEIAIVEQAGRAPARALARKLTTIGRQAALFVPIGAGSDIDTAGFDAAIAAYRNEAEAYRAYRESPAGQRDRSLDWTADEAVTTLARRLREIRSAYDTRRQVPLQYELLLLPFYEEYGDFWTRMLEVVERNPWRQARALGVAAAPSRILPPPPQADLSALDAEQLAAWRHKNQAAQELLVDTNALISAWHRYTDWVDLHRGPTGKENGAGSFAAIDRTRVVATIDAARRLAKGQPEIEALDTALNRYADGIEKVLPVAVEASGYYQRQDFIADRMQQGIAMHRRLVDDFAPFLEARNDLSLTVHVLVNRLEDRDLALLEQREGKSARWMRRNIIQLARGVQASVPRAQDADPAALERLDQEVAQLADAVRALEATSDTASGHVVKAANDYIGELRRIRRDYNAPGPKSDSWLIVLDTDFAALTRFGSPD